LNDDLRHGRLAATLLHEGHPGEAVELGEPGVDVGHHRLEQQAALDPPHAHAVSRQAKRQRQAHGLAAPVHE
jgi:hypothetical protein